jgi:hypothetical protein
MQQATDDEGRSLQAMSLAGVAVASFPGFSYDSHSLIDQCCDHQYCLQSVIYHPQRIMNACNGAAPERDLDGFADAMLGSGINHC